MCFVYYKSLSFYVLKNKLNGTVSFSSLKSRTPPQGVCLVFHQILVSSATLRIHIHQVNNLVSKLECSRSKWRRVIEICSPDKTNSYLSWHLGESLPSRPYQLGFHFPFCGISDNGQNDMVYLRYVHAFISLWLYLLLKTSHNCQLDFLERFCLPDSRTNGVIRLTLHPFKSRTVHFPGKIYSVEFVDNSTKHFHNHFHLF